MPATCIKISFILELKLGRRGADRGWRTFIKEQTQEDGPQI